MIPAPVAAGKNTKSVAAPPKRLSETNNFFSNQGIFEK